MTTNTVFHYLIWGFITNKPLPHFTRIYLGFAVHLPLEKFFEDNIIMKKEIKITFTTIKQLSVIQKIKSNTAMLLLSIVTIPNNNYNQNSIQTACGFTFGISNKR